MSERITSGIDLVEIERFRQLKPEILERFYKRVFTPGEIEHIGGSFERAAGLFAAKEAIVKALGCGIGPVSWQEVEILHNTRRKSASPITRSSSGSGEQYGEYAVVIKHQPYQTTRNSHCHCTV